MGHTLTNCLGFSEMQTMCKDKGAKIIETKTIKIASAFVNMVDVHVTTQSKANEEYVFKD
jgi:hypothetical protein